MKYIEIDKTILYEVYLDRDDDQKFNVGYIQYLDKDCILIKAIDPNGHFDGYDLFATEDVYQISYNTEYLKRLNILSQVTSQSDYDFGEISFENFAEFARKNNRVVGVALYGTEHELQGFVKNIDSNHGLLTISQLNSSGKPDGESIVLFEDIERISFDGIDYQKLETFYNNL